MHLRKILGILEKVLSYGLLRIKVVYYQSSCQVQYNFIHFTIIINNTKIGTNIWILIKFIQILTKYINIKLLHKYAEKYYSYYIFYSIYTYLVENSHTHHSFWHCRTLGASSVALNHKLLTFITVDHFFFKAST